MTSNSFRSEWVQNELSRAQRKRKPIFPLLLEGEPWVSVEAIQYVDVVNGRLPPQEFYRRLAKVAGKVSRSRKSDLAAPSDPFERKREEILRALHQVVEKSQTWNIGLFEVNFSTFSFTTGGEMRYLYAEVKDLDRLNLHAPQVCQSYKRYLEDRRIRKERLEQVLAEPDLPSNDPGRSRQFQRKWAAHFPENFDISEYQKELGILALWHPSADFKQLPSIASELVNLNQNLSLPLGLMDIYILH